MNQSLCWFIITTNAIIYPLQTDKYYYYKHYFLEVITMNFPAELKYTKDHEWMKMEGDIAVIGISDFAQDALGDVVFINLPEVGDTVTAGESFGDVESVKAVSDVNSPVTGVIVAVNEDLADSPENLNSDPYGSWIIKVENITATEELLDAAAYEAFCAEEG